MEHERSILIVRHCQAAGQTPDSPLTPVGMRQAQTLADFLAPLGIARILSSPYQRARDSAVPLASCLGIPIEIEERLRERTLSSSPVPDWYERLRESFDNLDMCLEGGESNRQTQARALAVVADVAARPEPMTAMFTHGNLMTLLLHSFDESFGFAAWRALTNPDVFALTLPLASARLRRLWPG